MAAIIKFTPLLGAVSEQVPPHRTKGRNGVTLTTPYASLLEIDDFTILLDCGWNDSLDPSILTQLIETAPTVDAILISHPDIYHCGALPAILPHLSGPEVKVYSSSPCVRFGHLALDDLRMSKEQEEEKFTAFEKDVVDSVFEKRYDKDL